MSSALIIANAAVLIPLSVLIAYYDARYRRIPNALVLGAWLGGLAAHAICEGWKGLGGSFAGCLLAFGLMLILHFVSRLGAGDVKLFGAIGALLGVQLVAPAFLAIVLVGGVLGFFAALRAGAVRRTMIGVWYIFAGLLSGQWWVRRAELVRSGLTIPYGIAITCGSLITVLGAVVWS